MAAIPYLAFDGTCAAAMRFYEKVLGFGARLELLVSGGDSPMAAQMPAEFRDRIMHARLAFDDGTCLYGGDAPANVPYPGMKGVSITMNYPTVAEAERVFKALAEGGQVHMALQPMFWARIFGMVVDRFGTPWTINGELQDVYAR